MTQTPRGPEDAALDALVDRARVVRPPTRTELDAGLYAVRARMERASQLRRWGTRLVLVGALALVPVAWFVGTAWFTPVLPELSYEVQGGSVLDGGYLRETGTLGVNVAFSEGSRFVLTPGSRGRLQTVSAEHARVGLEHGTALVDVTPDTGRLWQVEAGPFVVTVKGTAFTLAWDAAAERLELRLRHGRVVISGPISGGELTLQAGQRLSVSLPQATTLITEDRAEDEPAGVAAAPAEATASQSLPTALPAALASGDAQSPGGSQAGSQLPTGSQLPAPSSVAANQRDGATAERVDPMRRWSHELANGRWDVILADAERWGLAASLSGASSEDLFALASAARYRQRLSLAHDALQALRHRFPDSRRALDAIFLLGRVQEARAGESQQAITWYDEYLAQAPSGSYAAEALGRKLTIVNKTSGPMLARPIARDYLRRFPEGSYARLARALLNDD